MALLYILFSIYDKNVYKNILIPVDDQEQSYAAVRTAGMMAACEKAKITLYHVRKPPMEVVTDMVTKDKLFELPLKEHERMMFSHCDEVLSEFGIVPQMKISVAENVAAEILKECRSGDYDAIVMGHRGRKALKQLMLGSVANGVLTESECPVIMVHVPLRG
jgi:nucleotide-binding universal stress UspA family protein